LKEKEKMFLSLFSSLLLLLSLSLPLQGASWRPIGPTVIDWNKINPALLEDTTSTGSVDDMATHPTGMQEREERERERKKRERKTFLLTFEQISFSLSLSFTDASILYIRTVNSGVWKTLSLVVLCLWKRELIKEY